MRSLPSNGEVRRHSVAAIWDLPWVEKAQIETIPNDPVPTAVLPDVDVQNGVIPYDEQLAVLNGNKLLPRSQAIMSQGAREIAGASVGATSTSEHQGSNFSISHGGEHSDTSN